MKRYLSIILIVCCLVFLPNNTFAIIAQVSSQNAGQHSEVANTLANLAFPGSVTSGNTIIVAIQAYRAGVITINAPTAASGTATISTFTLDKNFAANSGSDRLAVSVYRAKVTGSGTLTIGFSGTFDNATAAVNEYSGFDTIPLVDNVATNSGTSVTESTGNVTASACGMIYMASTDVPLSNFTYTQSDTNVYKISTGASTATGQYQHKIIADLGTYTLTAGTANSWFWIAVGLPYRAAGCTRTIMLNGPLNVTGQLIIQ